jgi:CBS domain-containing protein
MATQFVLLREDMGIYEAIHMLLRHKDTGSCVVDSEQNLVGILSEKDCLRLFANAAYNQLPGGDVKHYMSTELTTIGPDEDIFTAAGVFLQNSYHRLPVLEHGKLIGLMSRRDVLEGNRHVWEESTVEKPWTDAKYLTDEIKAALE